MQVCLHVEGVGTECCVGFCDMGRESTYVSVQPGCGVTQVGKLGDNQLTDRPVLSGGGVTTTQSGHSMEVLSGGGVTTTQSGHSVEVLPGGGVTTTKSLMLGYIVPSYIMSGMKLRQSRFPCQ